MMSFWVKLINAVICVGLIIGYNVMVNNRQAEISAVSTVDTVHTSSLYNDGEYEGTAQGFGGDITVKVTIENGIIANLEIVSAEYEDDSFFESAVSIVDDILDKQTTDVDTVSGATFSSTGIKNAAIDALEKAKK